MRSPRPLTGFAPGPYGGTEASIPPNDNSLPRDCAFHPTSHSTDQRLLGPMLSVYSIRTWDPAE